jgi:RES domain-containing protein
MLLWRISNYATLDGRGGLLASARWHSAGRPIVYLAESPAGALTEVLVHLELGSEELPRTYKLLKIHIPDDLDIRDFPQKKLGKNWQNDLTITRTIGDEWLAARETALLRVPSVIVPETFNVLLNPQHADARRARVVSQHRYPWDQRLFR